ncbi:lipocalin family protein [Bacteriovoracaceae bacterium]|nr:lipocalin family protein [Bacteriovoracaceae bacterium]
MKKIICLLMLSSLSFAGKHKPLKTVDYVDLDRYLGKWYEIARFDQKFQRGCTATTAEYKKMKKKGNIKVINRCRLNSPDGKLKKGIGRAWIKNKKTNAKLKVQFFLRRIKLGFLAGKYWILALGENYDYAMVGDPSRKYLWILSRENTLDPEIYNQLVEQAEKTGFDTSKLLKTLH